jgi:hypothetical protein
MLKPSYDSQEAIPEDKRGAYVQKDGKWTLDELDPAHPVLVNNRALKSEKETAQSEAATAKSELANANIIPRGHEAVPKTEADLLRKVKEHGGTADEIVAKLTEYPTLKAEAQKQERRTFLEENVATPLKWNLEALARVPNLPDIEMRDTVIEGKTIRMPHAKIKDGDAFTYKPLRDFIAESADHKVFLPSLEVGQAAPGGTKVFGSTAGGGASKASIVDEFIKKRDEADASKPSPFARKTEKAA